MADIRVSTHLQKIVYGAAFNSMVANPDGPVGRMMTARANAIAALAREHCPVESPNSSRLYRANSAGLPPRIPPGRLRNSIEVRREAIAGRGIFWLIGSALPYARRIEFNENVGGWLRAALLAAEGVTPATVAQIGVGPFDSLAAHYAGMTEVA